MTRLVNAKIDPITSERQKKAIDLGVLFIYSTFWLLLRMIHPTESYFWKRLKPPSRICGKRQDKDVDDLLVYGLLAGEVWIEEIEEKSRKKAINTQLTQFNCRH